MNLNSETEVYAQLEFTHRIALQKENKLSFLFLQQDGRGVMQK